MQSKQEELQFRIGVVTLLQHLYERLESCSRAPLKELSQITGTSVEMTKRYVKGETILSFPRACEIYERTYRSDFFKFLFYNAICPDEESFYTQSIGEDPILRLTATLKPLGMCIGKRIECVLAIAYGGIPLGTTLSNMLNRPLFIASKERRSSSDIEVSIESGKSFYIPQEIKQIGKIGGGMILLDTDIKSGSTAGEIGYHIIEKKITPLIIYAPIAKKKGISFLEKKVPDALLGTLFILP